jgi:hypothetical protein
MLVLQHPKTPTYTHINVEQLIFFGSNFDSQPVSEGSFITEPFIFKILFHITCNYVATQKRITYYEISLSTYIVHSLYICISNQRRRGLEVLSPPATEENGPIGREIESRQATYTGVAVQKYVQIYISNRR